MSPAVSLILSILAALPREVAAISGAYDTVKNAFAATDRATISAVLAALDTKTDVDVAQLDRDLAPAPSGG
jgi:bifunctional pyridoxal-dependent enzyme with beta-cystathionase and maltose regulon repressor activities